MNELADLAWIIKVLYSFYNVFQEKKAHSESQTYQQ